MATKEKTKVSSVDLYKRYVWLADIINRCGPISKNSIDRKWADSTLFKEIGGKNIIPKRTFFHHLDAIENMFGIDVECNGFNEYYIANQDEIQGGGMEKWMLDTLTLSNTLMESRSIKDRIIVEDVPSGQEHLTEIIEAMREGITIQIEHSNFSSGETSIHDVDPYAVRLFKRRWYLIGYSHLRKSMRTFGIDRIRKVEPTYKTFTVPENFSPEEYFRNFYGVITHQEKKPEIVKIKVRGDQQAYVRSLKLHHSQEEVETTDDYSVFQYYLYPAYDFMQEILSRGAGFEVLSPEWFRTVVRNEILNMASSYK